MTDLRGKPNARGHGGAPPPGSQKTPALLFELAHEEQRVYARVSQHEVTDNREGARFKSIVALVLAANNLHKS